MKTAAVLCRRANGRNLPTGSTAIDGVSIPEAALNKRPSFESRAATVDGCLDKFLEAFDWVLSEIKKAEVRSPSISLAHASESSDHGTPA